MGLPQLSGAPGARRRPPYDPAASDLERFGTPPFMPPEPPAPGPGMAGMTGMAGAGIGGPGMAGPPPSPRERFSGLMGAHPQPMPPPPPRIPGPRTPPTFPQDTQLPPSQGPSPLPAATGMDRATPDYKEHLHQQASMAGAPPPPDVGMGRKIAGYAASVFSPSAPFAPAILGIPRQQQYQSEQQQAIAAMKELYGIGEREEQREYDRGQAEYERLKPSVHDDIILRPGESPGDYSYERIPPPPPEPKGPMVVPEYGRVFDPEKGEVMLEGKERPESKPNFSALEAEQMQKYLDAGDTWEEAHRKVRPPRPQRPREPHRTTTAELEAQRIQQLMSEESVPFEEAKARVRPPSTSASAENAVVRDTRNAVQRAVNTYYAQVTRDPETADTEIQILRGELDRIQQAAEAQDSSVNAYVLAGEVTVPPKTESVWEKIGRWVSGSGEMPPEGPQRVPLGPGSGTPAGIPPPATPASAPESAAPAAPQSRVRTESEARAYFEQRNIPPDVIERAIAKGKAEGTIR